MFVEVFWSLDLLESGEGVGEEEGIPVVLPDRDPVCILSNVMRRLYSFWIGVSEAWGLWIFLGRVIGEPVGLQDSLMIIPRLCARGVEIRRRAGLRKSFCRKTLRWEGLGAMEVVDIDVRMVGLALSRHRLAGGRRG